MDTDGHGFLGRDAALRGAGVHGRAVLPRGSNTRQSSSSALPAQCWWVGPRCDPAVAVRKDPRSGRRSTSSKTTPTGGAPIASRLIWPQMFGMDAALRRPVGAARRPCHFNQPAPSAREMAWPISLGSYCLSATACRMAQLYAAFSISAFAFSLSDAHSPHGKTEEECSSNFL